ncbi:sporulation-delaying protein SdpB family protein [Streptomyces alboflavus]|uniref:sporulation-delaying protein SdpB family protein n=1 Tax=Streptomyces alboflavus TaxID=67267 RepID=UPI00369FEEBA
MLTGTRTLPLPWTSLYGLARTLVALGTAGTLTFSSAETLFRPVATLGPHPACEGPGAASVFCFVPEASQTYTGLTWMKWLCVLVLLVVASGWRPRLTALPHAYVNFSVFTGIAIGDGGDQVGLILSVLLALPALGDRRRWHWQRAMEPDTKVRVRRGWAMAGISGLMVLRLQMSFLYFQAAVAKFPHTEWADGTAMWYWGTSLQFGPPPWLAPLVEWVVSIPLGVALMTWLPLVIEMLLAAALLLPQKVRWGVLWAGLGFHLMIALIMGLWSFALAMAGGIVILCCPLGAHLTPRRRHTFADEDMQDDTNASVSASDKPMERASATS